MIFFHSKDLQKVAVHGISQYLSHTHVQSLPSFKLVSKDACLRSRVTSEEFILFLPRLLHCGMLEFKLASLCGVCCHGNL